MKAEYLALLKWAEDHDEQNFNFIRKFKFWDSSKKVDKVFKSEHEAVFKEISCLDCANCCRTTNTIVAEDEIYPIATFLNIKPETLIKDYLVMDEDGDFVFNGPPCPFLAEDNKCKIYEVRPHSCADYPHTDAPQRQRHVYSIANNTLICPAVAKMVQNMQEQRVHGSKDWDL